jgi:pimeloyl-ACP methyl ester carboxylesterase
MTYGPSESTDTEAGTGLRSEVLRVASGTGVVGVASLLRPAAGDAVLLLHGLGSAKESYIGAFEAKALRRFALCAIDFPGHGATVPLRHARDAMVDYARIAADAADLLKFERVHLVGHSMGTAAGLLAAESLGERLGHFVSIEGNLVASDCGLVSRGIADESLEEFTQYGFAALLADLEESDADDLRAWGEWARSCEPAAFHAAARSLVAWSDSGALAERYRRLRSRAYLYGANGSLPTHLNGIVNTQEAHRIAESGHFPMIDNPGGLWQAVARSIAAARPPAMEEEPQGDTVS